MAKDKKNGIIKEFKEFISKGNVFDMAVGVIIAGAFGKITTSLIDDVLMPFIGWLIGDVDFTKLKLILVKGVETIAEDGTTTVTGEVAIRYGTLISVIINFLLIALVVFLLVKGINTVKRKAEERKKKEEEEKPAAPAEPSKEEKLLTEIRDLLKQKN